MIKGNKDNRNQGITLVALIITIIILIILAAVTINSVYNLNILNMAQKAAEEYTEGQYKEKEEFDKLHEIYSKILVADNDDAVISNITVKDLKTLIKENVDEAVKDKVSKEEYNTLLGRVETLENKKNRSGNVSFGVIAGRGGAWSQVVFEEALPNANYSVTVTHTGATIEGWNTVDYSVYDKTEIGFKVYAYNSWTSATGGNVIADWILSIN